MKWCARARLVDGRNATAVPPQNRTHAEFLEPFYGLLDRIQHLRGTMARDPFAASTPDLEDVLDALDDADCRTIIANAGEPQTASELADSCDIPLSTMYRKLELLSDASLLEEQIEMSSDGRHTTRYERDFDEVRIGLDDDELLELSIKRPESTPEKRLSELWSEVRKET